MFDIRKNECSFYAGLQDHFTSKVLYKLIYSVCGLVMGLACIIIGTMLLLNKLPGTNIGALSKGGIVDAALWASLCIVGLFVIVVTRLNFSLRGYKAEISNEFLKTLNAFSLVYSVCGLVAGAVSVTCGILLSLRTTTDGVFWALIVKAALEIILFGIGLFLVAITIYRVREVSPKVLSR